MKGNRGTITISIVLIIFIILLSTRMYFLTAPDEKSKEKNETDIDDSEIIYEENHSIFNGTPYGVIAQRFSEALDEPLVYPYASKSSWPGGTKLEYELQNDYHLIILYDQMSTDEKAFRKMELIQSPKHDSNGTYGINHAKDLVLDFVRDFFLEFNVDLCENYEIYAQSWSDNWRWKVKVLQVYENETLNGTGIRAFIPKYNGNIELMWIFDWLHPNSPINRNVTIDAGQKIIYQEIKNNGFNFTIPCSEVIIDENNNSATYGWDEYRIIPINQSDIKFIGYTGFIGKLGLSYEIQLKINDTEGCSHFYIINIENGERLYWNVISNDLLNELNLSFDDLIY